MAHKTTAIDNNLGALIFAKVYLVNLHWQSHVNYYHFWVLLLGLEFTKVFFNVGPPKVSIFLITIYGLYFSHITHQIYRLHFFMIKLGVNGLLCFYITVDEQFCKYSRLAPDSATPDSALRPSAQLCNVETGLKRSFVK